MHGPGRIIPRKVLTSVEKRGKGFSARQRPGASFPPFWIFCRSGHVSIIESLASAATDEFQLVAGWPMSWGTSYGVSRILYEFLSWSDSFICLSSIPTISLPLSLSTSPSLHTSLPPSRSLVLSFCLSSLSFFSVVLCASLFVEPSKLPPGEPSMQAGRLD